MKVINTRIRVLETRDPRGGAIWVFDSRRECTLIITQEIKDYLPDDAEKGPAFIFLNGHLDHSMSRELIRANVIGINILYKSPFKITAEDIELAFDRLYHRGLK